LKNSCLSLHKVRRTPPRQAHPARTAPNPVQGRRATAVFPAQV